MGRPNPIPPERVALETRLISVLDQDEAAITAVLGSFPWDEHRELVCYVLARIAERQAVPRYRAAMVEAVNAWCVRARGPECSQCPVERTRRLLPGERR